MSSLFLASESDRLAALARCAVLDFPFEENFEHLARLAAHQFGVPVARLPFVSSRPVNLEPAAA